MDVDFPEREQWEQETAEERQRSKEFAIDPFGPVDEPEEGDFDWDDELDEEEWVEPVRPPETVVREEPKIGRNDPCPCGSGKRYKKCCLHRDQGDPLGN